MTTKVLVADDSQTIQKVVKITLSGQDFDIVPVLSEETLIDEIKRNQFDLLLLDINLSDEGDGFSLAREIKKISPKTPILAMLSTFDSINESEMHAAGIEDKVVKPFESDKFIRKCQDLIDGKGPFKEVDLHKRHSLDTESEFASGWVVDSPMVDDHSNNSTSDDLNALKDEVTSWDVEIPGVIGHPGMAEVIEIPSVMESSHEKNASEDIALSEPISLTPVEESEDVLPNKNDLDYPDEVDYVGSPESELESVKYPGAVEIEASEDFSPLENKDDIENEIEDELDSDKTDPNFQLSSYIEERNNEEVESLWAKDEDHVALKREVQDIKEESVEEKKEIDEFVEISEPQKEEVVIQKIEIDEDEIVSRITESLRPIIEEMIQEACSSKVEKVAWEVIPDLAENLIKKEIQEISKSVID